MRPRSEHFVLLASGFLADPEFRRLFRLCDTDEKFVTAVGAWVIGLAAARRAKNRAVDFASESGVEWVNDVLRAAGLADDVGVPKGPFEKWAPAKQYPSDAIPKTPSTPQHPGNSVPPRSSPLTPKTSGQVRSGHDEEEVRALVSDSHPLEIHAYKGPESFRQLVPPPPTSKGKVQ